MNQCGNDDNSVWLGFSEIWTSGKSTGTTWGWNSARPSENGSIFFDPTLNHSQSLGFTHWESFANGNCLVIHCKTDRSSVWQSKNCSSIAHVVVQFEIPTGADGSLQVGCTAWLAKKGLCGICVWESEICGSLLRSNSKVWQSKKLCLEEKLDVDLLLVTTLGVSWQFSSLH